MEWVLFEKPGHRVIGTKLEGPVGEHVIDASSSTRIVIAAFKKKNRDNIRIPVSNYRVYHFDDSIMQDSRNLFKRLGHGCLFLKPDAMGQADYYINVPDRKVGVVVSELKRKYGKKAVCFAGTIYV